MAHQRLPGSADYAHIFWPGAQTVDVAVSVGDITTSITPPAPATLTVDIQETLSGFSISAGAFRVWIKNLGSTIEVGGTPGVDADITVNGDTLAVGGELFFEFVFDAANEEFKTLPAFTIVNGSGAGVWYRIES